MLLNISVVAVLGSSQRYDQQLGNPCVQMALQMLLTDTSSMGQFVGDPVCGNPIPEKFSTFIVPIWGRWKSKVYNSLNLKCIFL